MTYRVPHRLGHVVLPPEHDRPVAAYLMPLPDGDPVALHGTAALIWVVAAEGDPDVPAAVADLLGVEVDTIADETRAYLGSLVDARLLERAP